MAIVARGMLITEAYRDFKGGKFIVNRKYQRKLVWTIGEKQNLIDSIMKGYPIPLILLAHTKDDKYEVIDGMQRLDAIFSFIDNKFSLEDGRYFDTNEFQTSKLYSVGELPAGSELLTQKECADITEYQLAVTVFPIEDESSVTDIFGRINSGGRQLSSQEKRQAGVDNKLSNFIRKVSSTLRMDITDDVIELSKMPSISIDGVKKSDKQGYGINAEDTFWVRQGILTSKDLRDSVDEQIIADLSASILLRKPFASSKENLDELYDNNSTISQSVIAALLTYREAKLEEEINTTISTILDVINNIDNGKYAFKNIVIPEGKASSSRTPFYAVFMAFYRLIVEEGKKPSNYVGIGDALNGLNEKLAKDKHHVTIEDRNHNIRLTYGLLVDHFVTASPSLVGHGQGLIIEFEASLSRSKIETARYEMKQGILNIDGKGKVNNDLLNKINEIICSMANIGPESAGGNIFIGIADNSSDADVIEKTYHIKRTMFSDKCIVGVERECEKLGLDLNQYMAKIVDSIKHSKLSHEVKADVLTNIDNVVYDNKTIIWIKVPTQKVMAWIGENTYHREDSRTVAASSRVATTISNRFN
ncbi:GmrSD restriction endonuclease domain-containing protein [Pantoea agglomerans]|jgi:cyclophilin family peptidyl-prolyl cis-trans isomerase|uniref:GmrSD restriction endonuclease domain-containing protein n=1 Tax=Enterobacter agglomerans TaxID=549 RepID=UPI003ED9B28C